jgi:riboflavin synthase
MFTGIIEALGTLKAIRPGGTDVELDIDAGFDLSQDQLGDSIAVSGVCLTVTRKAGTVFPARPSAETLKRTILGELKPGAKVHVERALTLCSRLGGHLVQGHVDTVATVVGRQQVGGSLRLKFNLENQYQKYVIEKGSIAVSGVSLTVNAIDANSFEVNLIPHTADCTSLTLLKPGDRVNLEFDVIGKYVEKLLRPGSNASLETLLKNQGFM